MEISLSNLNWEVKGYWPYVPEKEKSMETGQTLHGVTGWIPAKVPGGVHADLYRAGMLENPYFGLNSLTCEWVENRWWMYRASFPSVLEGHDLTKENVSLLCKGLDYDADLFLNDEKIAEHRDGMFVPLQVELTGKFREENRLVVIFRGIPREMGQIGYTSRTSTQKSRFNYKWDFSTHLVNIGFWQDVVLKVGETVCLEDDFLRSEYDGQKGFLRFSGQVQGRKETASGLLRMKVSGPVYQNLPSLPAKGRSATAATPTEISGEWEVPANGAVAAELSIESPALWYPNGAGEQPLYFVTVEYLENGCVLWQKQYQQGIRSLQLAHNEQEHKNALPYTFVVNGKKIYCKGVNMTPLDHVYGCVDTKRYEAMVRYMVNAGVNLVRVWGGGLIEKEEFYRLCDENGLMVWQEFIQSSSGIDNIPCEDEAFLRLLKKNTEAAVRQKRNHTALAVYGGGNELMEREDTPVSLDNKNVRMLAEIVNRLDGTRMFYPTSATGPREFLSRDKGVSHDVHGSWRYEGNPNHYSFYGNSDNLFHSEFGMDGVSCVSSLEKFLPESALHPTPMSGDLNWQHHGEWWGTYFRDCEIFGDIPKTREHLQEFVDCSQYMQAEGLRYIIESDRRRAFQNSGVIIWQINEPWPNASCTNLVDYYHVPKAAYSQTVRVFEPFHVSMEYPGLTLVPGETVRFPVWLSHDGEAQKAQVKNQVLSKSGSIFAEETLETTAPENRSAQVGFCQFTVPQEPLVFVRLLAECGENTSENVYIFGTQKDGVLSGLRTSKAKVEVLEETDTPLSGGSIHKTVKLKNTGTETAVQVSMETPGYCLLGKENHLTLFPGKCRSMEFLLVPAPHGPFEEEPRRESHGTFHWMGKKG